MAQRRAFCLAEGVPRAFFTGIPSEHGAWRSTMTRPSPQFPFRPLMPAPKKPQATRAARKSAARPSKLLAERLTQLVSDALSSAAETLLGVKGDEFSLLPLNPVRVVVALSGGRDSMALLDVVEKLFHRPRQYLIARVHAVYVNHGLSPNARRLGGTLPGRVRRKAHSLHARARDGAQNGRWRRGRGPRGALQGAGTLCA